MSITINQFAIDRIEAVGRKLEKMMEEFCSKHQVSPLEIFYYTDKDGNTKIGKNSDCQRVEMKCGCAWEYHPDVFWLGIEKFKEKICEFCLEKYPLLREVE